ncbi:hypothetical protein AB4099_09975 [Bosea sp. 2KB_26]|uniref:hypothetical protein n=1 Tax=Bosea sp. 2KB_26 TaxID=3237475 RepID=UPI0013AFFFB9
MSKLITRAAIVVAAVTLAAWVPLPSQGSCNSPKGCTMDAIYESYDMMHNGQMQRAMEEGQANIAAFHALKEWELRHSGAPVHHHS